MALRTSSTPSRGGHNIGLWDAQTGRSLRLIDDRSQAVVLSADNRYMYSYHGPLEQVTQWDVDSTDAIRFFSATTVSTDLPPALEYCFVL